MIPSIGTSNAIGAAPGVRKAPGGVAVWDGTHDTQLSLDGSTEYLTADGAVGSFEHTGYSVLARLKRDATGGNDGFYAWGTSGGAHDRSMHYASVTDRPTVYAYDAANAGVLYHTPAVNTWTETTMVSIAQATKLSADASSEVYKFGSILSEAGGSDSGNNADITSSLDRVVIGACYYSGGVFIHFGGDIVEVAIMNREITAGEASEFHNSGTAWDLRDSTFADALVHYWAASWNTGTSTVTLPDLVGSADATLIAGDSSNLVAYP